MNEHDVGAFVACFDPGYRSEQPAHPNRGFGGREQVEKNWSALFGGIPDFHAELLRLPPPVRRCGQSGTGRALERMKRHSRCVE